MRYASEAAEITKECRPHLVAEQLGIIDMHIEEAARKGQYSCIFELRPSMAIETGRTLKAYGYEVKDFSHSLYEVSWGNV